MTAQKLVISFTSENQKDIIQAWLSTFDIDSIVENEDSLDVYSEEEPYTKIIQLLQEKNVIQSHESKIEKVEIKNWNAEWEANFKPVTIDKVYIRAPFHEAPPSDMTDIVISPKMAFGTGHHETTYMMISYMSNIDISGMEVLDYGCGTGILSVYAIMCNAVKVDGNDIQEEAIENSLEHIQLNNLNADVFNIVQGDLDKFEGHTYDIILANINRHVLLTVSDLLPKFLNKGGLLIMSGILKEDRALVLSQYEQSGWALKDEEQRGEWCRFCFTYKS